MLKIIKSKIAAWFRFPSNPLFLLAACLFCLDHAFSALTWAAASFAAGAMIIRSERRAS